MNPRIEDVTEALRLLAAEASVRAVVLRGTGDRGFVAGADIKEMGKLDATSAELFIDKLQAKTA